jgi:hypothetical protein
VPKLRAECSLPRRRDAGRHGSVARQWRKLLGGSNSPTLEQLTQLAGVLVSSCLGFVR